MAFTRTALGTAKAKASGTTLSSAEGITLSAGDCLIVGVGFQQQSQPTSVTWGNRTLRRSVAEVNGTSGHGCSIWLARTIVNSDTRTVTATWDSAIGARVMFMAKLNAGVIRDQYATSSQTATGAPSVGPTSELDYPNDFAVSILCARGPSNDTAPSVSGWTAGQTDGTVGVPPVSNITIHELYQQLTKDYSAVTCTGSGADERDWVSCIVAFRGLEVLPTLDSNGDELLVGDTVTFEGDESTISSFTKEKGIPAIVAVLADGRQVLTYYLTLVG